MKSKILTLIFIAFTTFSFAQTFYDNAPCLTVNPGSGISFDWTQSNYQIHTISLGSTNIQSPFHLSSLNNPNVNDFSKYQLKDNDPNKGWALITHDFGTSQDRKDVIYFILYNKHTGLLRVFFAFANLLEQNNGISISLHYKKNGMRSAILENYNGTNYRNATKAFDNKVLEIKNSNYYINQRLTWYSTDFYLHYDPCICNYATSFILTAHLIKSSDLSFKFKGQLLQNIAGLTSPDSKGRLGDNGIFSWVDMNAYKTQPVFRDVYAGSQFGKKLVESKWLNLSNAYKSGWLSLFNGFIDNIPIIGAAANFLTSIFEKNTAQQSLKPLTFDISLEGNGKLNLESPYDFREIPIPGSYQQLFSTEVKPFYNAIPGVFTLLETPEIDFYESVAYLDEWVPYEFHERDTRIEYKLKSNKILYSINPHAGFDIANSTIKGQLIFLGTKEGEVFETPLSDLGCLNFYRKNFSSYRKEQYNPDYELIEDGWTPNQVLLKIAANFKVAGSNIEIPYVATYNIKLIDNWPTMPSGIDELPPSNCNIQYQPANAAEIKSVCNSEIYKDKVVEFFSVEEGKDIIDSSNRKGRAFVLYPNPTSFGKMVTLKNNTSNNYKSLNIKILSVNGIVLKEFKIPTAASYFDLDVSNLTKGIYLVQILAESHMETQKLLIN